MQQSLSTSSRTGQQRFNAVLLRNDATRETVGLSRDSVLELTGVALIQNGTAEWPGVAPDSD